MACQSTCFCAEHHLHAQPFYVWPFPKTLVHTLLRFNFKPWFTHVYANTMLCVKARLPTKENANSQKTTCFKCFTETPCFTQTSRKIMLLLRPSILAAAMLSCTHLHFISSYVLSLLYMFETPKSFQLRPWPQICTPILTAATLYCMHVTSLL